METKPSPIGVVHGPFSATWRRVIASRVSRGSTSWPRSRAARARWACAHYATVRREKEGPSMPDAVHLGSGKVRELYALDDERFLLVVSDCISIFDVVLPIIVPDKGRVLTGLAAFWFARTH